ncbi:MAG: hypothetical protein ABJL67_16535 [Sulfitobacter sp.]
MTATAQFMDKNTPTAEAVSMVDGGRMILRGAFRLLGVALAIAAIGLWLAPGASWDTDILLFKLILSICAFLAGLGMLGSSSRPLPPEVEIDTIRREIRLVRRPRGAKPTVLQSCEFSDLAYVEQTDASVRLWDKAGVFLAEVSLSERSAFNSLVAGLRDEGKLA